MLDVTSSKQSISPNEATDRETQSNRRREHGNGGSTGDGAERSQAANPALDQFLVDRAVESGIEHGQLSKKDAQKLEAIPEVSKRLDASLSVMRKTTDAVIADRTISQGLEQGLISEEQANVFRGIKDGTKRWDAVAPINRAMVDRILAEANKD